MAVGLGWFFNLAISSCIFMLVCYHLNQATGTITKWICSSASNASSSSNTSSTTTSSNQQQQDAVPLLPTTVQDNDDTKPEDDETWQQESLSSYLYGVVSLATYECVHCYSLLYLA